MAAEPKARIRVEPATDPERFHATDQVTWPGEPEPGPVEERLRGVPEDQRFAADVVGVPLELHAGIYGVRPLRLTVPGADDRLVTVPCAGLTWVGVHPDVRRRGVLTAMLRDHFARTRAEGVWLSALHASEPLIYGRHGYGVASREFGVTLSAGTTVTAPGLERAAARVTTRLEPLDRPGRADQMRLLAGRVCADQLGAVTFLPGFYEAITSETPEELRGHEPMQVLIARTGRRITGMAMLRRELKWEGGNPVGTLEARTLIGDPANRLALLRRLVGFDLVTSSRLHGVAEHDPLWHWLPGGHRGAAAARLGDSLWIRLVDLPRALMLRGYAADCDVVLEVRDDAAPWNRGRWRLVVADGRGEVEKARGAADLVLDAAHLGAVYLGGTNLLDLVTAGLVRERRPGAARELWQALRADVAPVAAAGF